MDPIGSLVTCTSSVLARLDELLDAHLAALPLVQVGKDDLIDVQEAVLLEADVDERGFHPGKHRVDAALVHVPHDRAASAPLDVGLAELATLDHGNPNLLGVGRYEDAFDRGHAVLLGPRLRAREGAAPQRARW